MAKRELHALAIEMRKQGMSYSQIKREIGVSKSTLGIWLEGMPLTRERVNELRGNNEQRIERYRESRLRTKNIRHISVYEKVSADIGTLSTREALLCGLYLYWGEGGKTQTYTVSLSNTDPAILIFFKSWLGLLGVPQERLKVRLQLYADMNVEEEMLYWSKMLNLPLENFRKSYIKSSNRIGLTYKQKFIHGTCNIIYDNRDIGEYVHAAMKLLQTIPVATYK